MVLKKMAQISPSKSIFLFLVLTTFLTYSPISSLAAAASPSQLKETKFSVFYHDYLSGPNTTFMKITGIPGNRWSLFDFGTFYITDDMVREGLSPDSPIVGRGRGIYAVSALDGTDAYTSSSLVFTNNAYRGSTLEFQGHFAQNVNITEISIVAGTGIFRYARGYSTFETFVFNSTYTVARCNITLRLD